MTRQVFIAAALALFLCVQPVPAKAQIDEAGAQKLKGQIQKELDFQTAVLGLEEMGILKLDGELEIKPAGSFYEVRSPRISLAFPDGAVFEAGTFIANVSPGAAPDEWRMSIALPTPMSLLDGAGKAVFQVNIGGQRFSGVWLPDAAVFPKFDGAWQSLKIEAGDGTTGKMSIAVGHMLAMMNMSKDKNGLWSGPFSFEAKNLAVSMEAGQEKGSATLDTAKSQGSYAGMDFSMNREFREVLKKITAAGKKPSAEDIEQFLSGWGKMLTGMYDSATMMLLCSGFKAEWNDGEKPAGVRLREAK